MIWTSDEDVFSLEKINNILRFIECNNPSAVFLNHYQIKNKKLKPIRFNFTRKFRSSDFWDCCHMPGVLWRREDVLKELSDWDDDKEKYKTLCHFYPNLYLLVKIFFKHRVFFFSGFLTLQKDFEKSQHIAKQGTAYSHLSPRWEQHNDIIHLIDHCRNITNNNNYQGKLIKLKKELNKNIFQFLSNALLEENKEIYYYFSRSCQISNIFIRRYKFFSKFGMIFAANPITTWKSIFRRLKTYYGL